MASGMPVLWLRQCCLILNRQQMYIPFGCCFQGICNVQLGQGILLGASKLHHSQLSTRVSLPTQTLAQDQKLLNLTMEGRLTLGSGEKAVKNTLY